MTRWALTWALAAITAAPASAAPVPETGAGGPDAQGTQADAAASPEEDTTQARPAPRLPAVSEAIDSLDLEAAERLLAAAPPTTAAHAFERGRLALHRGECDLARVTLSSASLAEFPEAASLAAVARGCAGVVAGAVVEEDTARGVRVVLQDGEDVALVPFVVDVAVSAREAAVRDLGVELPRPLRLTLVRDLFSLSQVTGLPLEAAETTGTVAVARFAQVLMLSPRAVPRGYPWQDTLVHEVTHLALARATRDRAPLWLQEGLAKRSETRWRDRRPFDELFDADATARAAARTGRSVGVDRLGPSIALLPTPDAAAVAYAEVTSFVEHFIAERGVPALRLVLLELRGGLEVSAALTSVTGYGLKEWMLSWERWLTDGTDPEPPLPGRGHRARGLARTVRLGDLLAQRGHAEEAARDFARAAELAPGDGAVRARRAAVLWATSPEGVQAALGRISDLAGPEGAWFGHAARAAEPEPGAQPSSPLLAELALAHDPLGESAACRGRAAREPLPDLLSPRERALCEAARRHARTAR